MRWYVHIPLTRSRSRTVLCRSNARSAEHYVSFRREKNLYLIADCWIQRRYDGVPLTLKITVIDTTTCLPVQWAAVDVWHCNSQGVYSGFSAENTAGLTFLRGIQFTDNSGLATFDTIYPGWYSGRVTHVHVKVHVNLSNIQRTYSVLLFLPRNFRVYTVPGVNNANKSVGYLCVVISYSVSHSTTTSINKGT